MCRYFPVPFGMRRVPPRQFLAILQADRTAVCKTCYKRFKWKHLRSRF